MTIPGSTLDGAAESTESLIAGVERGLLNHAFPVHLRESRSDDAERYKEAGAADAGSGLEDAMLVLSRPGGDGVPAGVNLGRDF